MTAKITIDALVKMRPISKTLTPRPPTIALPPLCFFHRDIIEASRRSGFAPDAKIGRRRWGDSVLSRSQGDIDHDLRGDRLQRSPHLVRAESRRRPQLGFGLEERRAGMGLGGDAGVQRPMFTDSALRTPVT